MASGLVVVIHPGVQHSRELVKALHQGRLLSRFVTSFNGRFGEAVWLPGPIRNRLRKRCVEGVPNDLVITIPYIEAITWALGPALDFRQNQRLYYAGLDLFDKLASAFVVSSSPRIVVGFENSCRHSFRKARAVGALCVLDAASVHHSAQPAHDADMDAPLRAHISTRKDEEVQLADHIVVLSTYARDTYVAAGVPGKKISIVPLGAYLPGPTSIGLRRAPAAGVRFLFVGNIKYAKGIDLLLDAFSRLDADGKELTIAGALIEPGALPQPLPPGVQYIGRLERDAVFDAHTRADVLVLPSRADGFGLVVAEAMASGLPVIVSSAVGAKDLVSNGTSGWIFQSGSEVDLRRVMTEAIARRNDLAEMGVRAQQSVVGLTWEAYGERIRGLYRHLLDDSGDISELNRSETSSL